jgi:hypothetical protein
VRVIHCHLALLFTRFFFLLRIRAAEATRSEGSWWCWIPGDVHTPSPSSIQFLIFIIHTCESVDRIGSAPHPRFFTSLPPRVSLSHIKTSLAITGPPRLPGNQPVSLP